MPVLAADYLHHGVCRSLFAAAGASEEEADTVGARLVEANLLGHDSHGVIRIPQYLAAIEAGGVQPGAPLEITRETSASAALDGHWGFGQVVASKAAAIAATKARHVGVAAVTVRNSYHIGRLGSYVEELARDGLLALLLANAHGTGPCVAPWGGAQRRLATNPLAVGIPTTSESLRGPIVLDMTTSSVAEGKVRVKRNRGERVPDGWLLDAEGRPTNDPESLYGAPRGSILPFGGSGGAHKGYGLNVVVDLLAGALSGASTTTGSPDAQHGNAFFFMVLDPFQFIAADDYYPMVDGLVSFVKSSVPMASFEEVLVPGEIEERERAERGEKGIFVEEETWRQILACADALGVSVVEKIEL